MLFRVSRCIFQVLSSFFQDPAPNADAVSGADAIEQYWQSFFDMGIAGAQPLTQEVIPMGDYALEVGQYSVFGTDGAPMDRGKIMVLGQLGQFACH